MFCEGRLDLGLVVLEGYFSVFVQRGREGLL
jgi:hypothetical protein